MAKLTLSMPEEIIIELRAKAYVEGRTISGLVRRALQREMEDEKKRRKVQEME